MSVELTYDSGINKGAPAALILEKGEDERDSGGTKKDDDKLIFELFENQLPERGWGVFGDGYRKKNESLAGAWLERGNQEHTVAAMLVTLLVDLSIGQTSALVYGKLSEDLVDGPREGVLHVDCIEHARCSSR